MPRLSPRSIDQAVTELALRDRRLAALIRRVGPCTLKPRGLGDLFAALSRSIIYQQLSGRAADTIHARFMKLFPDTGPDPALILDMDPGILRGIGLSAPKIASLTDLAERAASGSLPSLHRLRAMRDEAVIQALLPIRGIGRWSVEMLLIFSLGRPDVLSATDLGIRKGMAALDRLEELPSPVRVEQRGLAWKPWRSVAGWYLWRAAENA